jgi:hypothetical protein
LLGKAQEIKDKKMPSMIEGSIEVIQGLAKRNVDVLDEVKFNYLPSFLWIKLASLGYPSP